MHELLRVAALMEPVPVAVRGALNLDGILTYAEAGDIAPSRSVDPPDVPIPVSRWPTANGRCLYLSSDALCHPEKRMAVHMTRRKDGHDADVLNRKFHRGLGPKRDRMLKIPAVIVEELHWWVHGDQAAIEALLRRVPGLGALRAHGYGRVRKWNVLSVPGGKEDAIRDGIMGRARRSVPAEFVARSSTRPVRRPYCPPYWHMRSIGPCYGLGDHIELRPDAGR